ncbi:MAG: lectin like domain-containing protein, partial [Eubacteriales bacterium]|nr:lectin like domain-containing protein [Eubacteriales bacterium]
MEWGIKDENGKATGYFYLSYYDRSVDYAEIYDFDVTGSDSSGYIIDQYDYLQSSGTNGWIDSNELQTANVFTAEYDEILRGLSCETSMKNTEVTYDVYLMEEDAAVPTDGEHALTVTETYELPGYHRLDLEAEQQIEIAKGQRYAVVLTQKTTYNGEPYYAISTTTEESEEAFEKNNRRLKAEHADESSYEQYYAVGVVNPGESFVYFAGEDAWSDFSEVVPALVEYEEFEDLTFDNFPIKAYLDYKNAEDQAAAEAENIPSLGYAEPAGMFDVGRLALYAVVVLIGLILVI